MQAIEAPIAFDGERFMPGGATVIVEDGVIKGVESAGYEVPAECPLTAFEGTILPGLFDAHVHLVSDSALGSLERAGSLDVDAVDDIVEQSLRQQAASGVTTVRDLGDVEERRPRSFIASEWVAHSHSMVPGGFEVMSRVTRLTSGTSLVIRVEIFSSRSNGRRAQSAVIASSEVTGRSTTGWP